MSFLESMALAQLAMFGAGQVAGFLFLLNCLLAEAGDRTLVLTVRASWWFLVTAAWWVGLLVSPEMLP